MYDIYQIVLLTPFHSLLVSSALGTVHPHPLPPPLDRLPTRPSPGRRRARGAWWVWTTCPGACSWTSTRSAPGTTAGGKFWSATRSTAVSACCWTMRRGHSPTMETGRPGSTPSTVPSPRSCSPPAGLERGSASPSAPHEMTQKVKLQTELGDKKHYKTWALADSK